MERLIRDKWFRTILIFVANFQVFSLLTVILAIVWIIAIPIIGPTECECGITYHINNVAACIVSFFIFLIIGIATGFENSWVIKRDVNKLIDDYENENKNKSNNPTV